jgi:hypothetical protein
MLGGGAKLTAFVATTDSARSKTFYQSTLGLAESGAA